LVFLFRGGVHIFNCLNCGNYAQVVHFFPNLLPHPAISFIPFIPFITSLLPLTVLNYFQITISTTQLASQVNCKYIPHTDLYIVLTFFCSKNKSEECKKKTRKKSRHSLKIDQKHFSYAFL
jgi:hypothetical protein